MKRLVALLAWSMPIVAALSSAGLFGPTNGEISNRYPTLIVAAGYAFSIWGPIFLLDVVYGMRQAMEREPDPRLHGIRPWTAGAFAMTSAWMIVFSQQRFLLALLIIWASLVCLLVAAWRVSDTRRRSRAPWWQWVPLSLHAGWVSLAVFLNVAQVVVAFQWASTTVMLPWTLTLFAAAATLVLGAIALMRGNPWYAGAVAWGLIGVYVAQSRSLNAGAAVASWIALGLCVAVLALSLWSFIRTHEKARSATADSTDSRCTR